MFTRKHILKIHYATHSSDKLFKCHTCDRSFNQKSNLKRHERIHEMTNFGYKCRICGQLFSQNAYMEKHMRSHEQSSKQSSNPIKIPTSNHAPLNVVRACSEQQIPIGHNHTANDSIASPKISMAHPIDLD